MACAWVRFRVGSIATHYSSFVKETRPAEFLASLARILKEPTWSPPSVAGVLYSDKRTKISAEWTCSAGERTSGWLERGGGVAKEARMADDVSDEPPVGDARTGWLPAQSAQILALGDAARRRNAAYQNAWQKLQPPAKTQPLKSSERRSLRQALQKQFAPALDAAEAIDAVLPTSKTPLDARRQIGRADPRRRRRALPGSVDGDANRRRASVGPDALVLQRCFTSRGRPARGRGARAPQARRGFVRGRRRRVRPRRGDGGIVARGTFRRPNCSGRARRGLCARFPRPVAVGRFSKPSEHGTGGRGACVDVLLRVGDGVWPNTAVDASTSSSSPPEFCVAAAAAAAERGGRARLSRGAPRRADRRGGGRRYAAEVLDLKADEAPRRRFARSRTCEGGSSRTTRQGRRGPALKRSSPTPRPGSRSSSARSTTRPRPKAVRIRRTVSRPERRTRPRAPTSATMALMPRPPALMPRPSPPATTRTLKMTPTKRKTPRRRRPPTRSSAQRS